MSATVSATSTVQATGSLPTGSSKARLGVRLPATSSDALAAWRAHQPDRAWIEWGVCWPPVSIRRPRCLFCVGTSWPCPPASAAAGWLVWFGRSADVRIRLPSRVNPRRRSPRPRTDTGPCLMNAFGLDVHPPVRAGAGGSRDLTLPARRLP